MKKKFQALLLLLKPFQNQEIKFSWWGYERNDIDYLGYFNIENLPNIAREYALDIIKFYSYSDEIDDLFNECYSETDNYQIFLFVKPKTNSMVVKLKYEYYSSQPETYERKLEIPELEDYFKRTGIEIIEARYSGGGDSGDIDSVTIDGEGTDIDWQSKEPDKKLIWNTLYDYLENAYGGWEINEGSAGTIEINNNMEIVISHEWNTVETEFCDEQFEITIDSFAN